MMRNLKYQFVLVLVFLMQWANAQPTFENEDVQDVPAASLEQWILPTLVIITTLMFVYFIKKEKQQIQ